MDLCTIIIVIIIIIFIISHGCQLYNIMNTCGYSGIDKPYIITYKTNYPYYKIIYNISKNKEYTGNLTNEQLANILDNIKTNIDTDMSQYNGMLNSFPMDVLIRNTNTAMKIYRDHGKLTYLMEKSIMDIRSQIIMRIYMNIDQFIETFKKTQNYYVVTYAIGADEYYKVFLDNTIDLIKSYCGYLYLAVGYRWLGEAYYDMATALQNIKNNDKHPNRSAAVKIHVELSKILTDMMNKKLSIYGYRLTQEQIDKYKTESLDLYNKSQLINKQCYAIRQLLL